MPADPTRGVALSFVDVLANGLGSLLVLFILLAAVKAQADFADAPDGAAEDQARAAGRAAVPIEDQPGPETAARLGRADAFLLLAVAPPDTDLFTDFKANPWRLTAADRGDFEVHAGPGFALLSGPRLPAGPVALTGVRTVAGVTVRIVATDGPELPGAVRDITAGRDFVLWVPGPHGGTVP